MAGIKKILIGIGVLYIVMTGSQSPAMASENYRLELTVPAAGQHWLFDGPEDVAFDSQGNVYVADTLYNRIQKFSADGTFITAWGEEASPSLGFSPHSIALDSTDTVYVMGAGPGIQTFSVDGVFLAEWSWKSNGAGIAVSDSGFVYLVDVLNHRIDMYTTAGELVRRWGVLGASPGQFNSPSDVALDSQGNVYVVDGNNHRVQKFTSEGVFLTEWGYYGTGGNGAFASPRGITVADVYSVSAISYGRVQKFTTDGQFLTRIGASTIIGLSVDVAVDSVGNIYVLDDGSNGIHKFDGSGQFLMTWEQASGLGISSPSQIAIDSQDNLFLADSSNTRIQKFTPDGVLLADWGGFGLDDDNMRGPAGVAVDDSGNVYVSDYFFHRIQKFTRNNPPVLAPIGDKTVSVGQLLEFTVSATDPDQGDPLSFTVKNLPPGAFFDTLTGAFSWTPVKNQFGSWPGMEFTVIDPLGESDSEAITITVDSATPPTFPVTWYVNSTTGSDLNPGDDPSQPFATINTALYWARNDQVIKVAAGTYTEGLLMENYDSLFLQGGWSADFSSRDPSLYESLLLGDNMIPGVEFNNSTNCIFDGFSIRNFTNGIRANGTQSSVLSVHVTRNTISECSGYGIWFGGCYLIIEENEVYANQNYGIAGHGPYHITRGDIIGNFVADNVWGGIYLISSHTWKVFNNIVVRNQKGGISASYPGMRAYVYNNTIMDNTGDGCATGYSGRIFANNNIIANNSKYGLNSAADLNYITSAYNNLYQNGLGDYLDVSPSPTDIYLTPDLDITYHLNPTSPMIDAGYNLSAHLEWDFDGNPRAVILGGDGLYNIGADEFYTAPACTDTDGDGYS